MGWEVVAYVGERETTMEEWPNKWWKYRELVMGRLWGVVSLGQCPYRDRRCAIKDSRSWTKRSIVDGRNGWSEGILAASLVGNSGV